MESTSRIGLDGRGSVHEVVLDETHPAPAVERLCTLFGDLLLTRFSPVGLDLREVPHGVVAIVSMCEEVGTAPPRYHAGTACAPTGVEALGRAVCEALLRDDDGNVLRAAARRAVEIRRARAVNVRIGSAEWSFGEGSVPPGSPIAALELADASLVVAAESPAAAAAVREWLARLQSAADVSERDRGCRGSSPTARA